MQVMTGPSFVVQWLVRLNTVMLHAAHKRSSDPALAAEAGSLHDRCVDVVALDEPTKRWSFTLTI